MTIDERIEALTESVELLASFHRDTEGELNTLALKLSELTTKVDQLADTVAPIVQLVIIHEQRIKDLETGR